MLIYVVAATAVSGDVTSHPALLLLLLCRLVVSAVRSIVVQVVRVRRVIVPLAHPYHNMTCHSSHVHNGNYD